MSQIIVNLDADARILLTAAAMLRELAEGGPKLKEAPKCPAESIEPVAEEATTPLESKPTPADAAAGFALGAAPESAESPSNASAPELDRDGLPWDSRIHSSSKSQNADGRWKKQRLTAAKNMTQEQWDAYIKQVENELRAALAAPVATVESVGMSPALGAEYSAAAPERGIEQFLNKAGAAIETVLTSEPEQKPDVPNVPPREWNFITLVSEVSNAGKTDAEVAAALAAVNLQSLHQLAARADLCAPFAAALGLK